MTNWYPPWAKEWQKENGVPSWTVEERHHWMSEALQFRRKIQAVNYGRDELEHYRTLLAEFFEHSNITGKDSAVLEILSDGLGDIEPVWHGINIEQGKIKQISPWMRADLIEGIRVRRTSHHEGLPFKTHLEIGSHLLEPSLFKVTKTTFQYYSKECWRELDNTESPLPLKMALERDINVNWEDVQSIKKFLPILIQNQVYKDRVNDIRQSLSRISRDVLWPALFDSKPDGGECLSLVLIQASMWQVPGVWALHAYSTAGPVSNKSFIESNLIQSTISPPTLCLNDALGALFKRYSTHEQQRNDLRLYRRSKGVTSHLPTDQEFFSIEDDDRALYNREMSTDPFERYGYIYEIVCERYMGGSQPDALEDSTLSLLNRALKQAFVALAIQPREPTVTLFILQDTVRVCLRLIDGSEETSSQNLGGGLPFKPSEIPVVKQAREHLNQMIELPYYETPSLGINSETVKLLTIAFLSVVLMKSSNLTAPVKEWLTWCGHGFRSLVLSSDQTESRLTREAYREWEDSTRPTKEGQASIEQFFSEAGIHPEAIWLLTSLLPRGEKA